MKSVAGPYLRCLEDPKVHEAVKDIHEGDCGNHSGARTPSRMYKEHDTIGQL
jgi:hypothetical protein